MSVRIVDVCEVTKPISSPIRNAYIDFTKMTTSLVAVVTDVVRDGKTVVGYGFNSNGRYGQGGLIRERFASRITEADHALYVKRLNGQLLTDQEIIAAALRSSSSVRSFSKTRICRAGNVKSSLVQQLLSNGRQIGSAMHVVRLLHSRRRG